MPIANPFQESGPGAGAVPESSGGPERRPDERDRTRTRTRKETRNAARQAPTAPHGDGQGPARDSAPADAPEAAEDVSAAGREAGGAGGEVVPFPGAKVETGQTGAGGELVPAALAEAAQSWWAEASATAGRAVDGSLWRARPPALRDSAVRLQRAEWSGGLPVLRWAGWVYGYPALAVRAALMGVIWLLDHPTRLLVLAGVIAAALYL